MPELLESYEFSSPRYPWAEWFDGTPRRLVKGTDFKVSVDNMRVNIYQASRRFGRLVRVKIEDKRRIVIQAIGDRENFTGGPMPSRALKAC